MNKYHSHFLVIFWLCTTLTVSSAISPAKGGAGSIDAMNSAIEQAIKEHVTIVTPVYDKAVQSYLRRYIEIYPRYTEEVLGRAAVYFPMFEKYLEANGMPTDLKYLAVVESGLKPQATSRVGATGIWQFMRGTGREYGLQINSYIDERRDPERSTEAAVRFLQKLHERFGSWDLAMAGYNAGPGRVEYAIRRAGSREFDKIKRYLPRETRNYIPGFIAVNYLFTNYDTHGLTPTSESYSFDDARRVRLFSGISLRDVNSATGIPLQTLYSLNPMYTRNYVPKSVRGNVIRLPEYAVTGLFEHLEIPREKYTEHLIEPIPLEALGNITYKKQTTWYSYRIVAGDNLYDIARANGCSVANLKKWNELTSNHLRIGELLSIRITELVAVLPKMERSIVEVPEIRSVTLLGMSSRRPTLPLYESSILLPKVTPSAARAVMRKRMSLRDLEILHGKDYSSVSTLETGPKPGYVFWSAK